MKIICETCDVAFIIKASIPHLVVICCPYCGSEEVYEEGGA
jgi:uncharacterized protein YbaR (Trm112 family)